MKPYIVDLHIHTRLSPCASEEMTPNAIVGTAKRMGLDIIAICDHNSSRNAAAVMEAGVSHSVIVIPGIDLETIENIHLIGLFPDATRAACVSEEVRLTLPDTDEAYTTRIGEQVLMSADGRAYGVEDKALASPAKFDLRDAVQLVKRNEGLAIAAHVERPSFSVYSQLGDIPRDIPFDALEVSPVNSRPVGLREKFARYGWPLIGSSDSHYLFEVGRARSRFFLESPCFDEICMALHAQNGRSVALA
jgi:3',5'-nucleoside bisphosphate phosphatase